VEVVRLVDAAAFLAEAEPLLLADEARHNLILGLAGTIRDSPDHYPSRSLWLVRDEGGKVAAAALRTPPYNLILAAPRSEEALAVLARGIAEDLPGVVGAEPESVGFADFWSQNTGLRARTNTRQGIFEWQHGIRGQCALRAMGFEAIPIINTDNACASSRRSSSGCGSGGALASIPNTWRTAAT